MLNIYDVVKCSKKHPSPTDKTYVIVDIIRLGVSNGEFDVVNLVEKKDFKKFCDKSTKDKKSLIQSNYLERYEKDVVLYRKYKIKILLNGVQNK